MPLLKVQRIKSAECYPLRQLVLRPTHPPEASIFPEDEIMGSFHLGGFDHYGHLIGISSFSPAGHEDIPSRNPFRLRGMAIHPNAQNQGVGHALMEAAVCGLKLMNCDLLWCHARTTALGFYVKQGFVVHGSEFLNPFGLPHFVMSRFLL